MHVLRRLAHESGRAVLLSTHDLDLALRTADHIWLLAEGRLHTGAPEDLVLNGTFATAFQADGVFFDNASGSFHFPLQNGAAIALTGDGAAYTWTQRALERVGYTFVHGASVRVQVVAAGEKAHWQLWTGEQCREYDTIQGLLQALNSAR
jgi:iron complex transport system ATP-binding protein